MDKEINWLTFRILVQQERLNKLSNEQIAKKLNCDISLVNKVFEENEIEDRETHRVLKVSKDIARKRKSITLTSNILEKAGIITNDFSGNEYVDIEINTISKNIVIKKHTKNSKKKF